MTDLGDLPTNAPIPDAGLESYRGEATEVVFDARTMRANFTDGAVWTTSDDGLAFSIYPFTPSGIIPRRHRLIGADIARQGKTVEHRITSILSIGGTGTPATDVGFAAAFAPISVWGGGTGQVAWNFTTSLFTTVHAANLGYSSGGQYTAQTAWVDGVADNIYGFVFAKSGTTGSSISYTIEAYLERRYVDA